MKRKIKYITSLTSADLGKMLTSDCVEAGSGIKVDRTDGGVRISLDNAMLGTLIWRYVSMGAITGGVNQVTATQAASIIDSAT